MATTAVLTGMALAVNLEAHQGRDGKTLATDLAVQPSQRHGGITDAIDREARTNQDGINLAIGREVRTTRLCDGINHGIGREVRKNQDDINHGIGHAVQANQDDIYHAIGRIQIGMDRVKDQLCPLMMPRRVQRRILTASARWTSTFKTTMILRWIPPIRLLSASHAQI